VRFLPGTRRAARFLIVAAAFGCGEARPTIRLTIELDEAVAAGVDSVEVTATGAMWDDNPEVVFYCRPCSRTFALGDGGVDPPLLIEVERANTLQRKLWFRVVLRRAEEVVGWQYQPVEWPAEGVREATMRFEADCVPPPVDDPTCTYPGPRHCLDGECRDPVEPEPFTSDAATYVERACAVDCEAPPDAGGGDDAGDGADA
jgi:hypothetical protein